MANRVNFYAVKSLDSYIALANKDVNTLYFIEDSMQIFKGEIDVTASVVFVNAPIDAANAFEGKLYVDTANLIVQVKGEGADVMTTLLPGYITDGTDYAQADGTKLATFGYIKSYIATVVEGITSGSTLISGVQYDKATGKVVPVTAAGTADAEHGAVLEGVAHDPVYDASALKLTIPVFNGQDVVIDIPKDNFIRSGEYVAEADLGDGKKGPAIVLTVNDAEDDSVTKEIVIPAAELIDVYTGEETNGITVSVSADNKISAAIKLSADNKDLVVKEDGLCVDLSGKLNVLGDGYEVGSIIIADENKQVGASAVKIQTEGVMLTDTTAVPVGAVVAAAIAAAINSAKTEINNLLAKKVDKVDGAVAGDIATFVAGGNIQDSGKKIGGATLADVADEHTLATEKAVEAAISWQTL